MWLLHEVCLKKNACWWKDEFRGNSVRLELALECPCCRPIGVSDRASCSLSFGWLPCLGGGVYTCVSFSVICIRQSVSLFFFLRWFHSHSKPISSPTPAFDSSRRLLPYFSATFRLLFSSWSCREGWIATSKMRKKWSCKRGVEKRGAGRGCKFGLEY